MHSEKISINSAEHMVLFKLFLSAKEMIHTPNKASNYVYDPY